MTAEGQEGSSLGNIRGKGGPGRGNSQCQNPKAGAAGRVHGPRRRQNGGEAGGGRAVWSERGQRQGYSTSRGPGSQDTEMDFSVWWEGVEGFEQKSDMTSRMHFTCGEWSVGGGGADLEQRRQGGSSSEI